MFKTSQLFAALGVVMMLILGCGNQTSSAPEAESQAQHEESKQDEGRMAPSVSPEEVPAGKDDVAHGEVPTDS